jgi:Arc/MetJ-type ribon-helix-helix transcriptional regulator
MKLSVSLPDEDVAILDEYVRTTGLPSRSAALQAAVRMLHLPHLEEDYAAAWQEWQSTGEESAWQITSSDGLTDAAR